MRRFKIVLINPGRYLHVLPPLSLCYLASYLESYSRIPVEVTIIDENSGHRPMDHIRSNEVDLVGFTATTTQIIPAARIAAKIKECKNIPIVIGGVHATAMPEKTLQEFPSFDYICIGEGEKAFKEFVETLADSDNLKQFNDSLEKLPSLAFRRDENIILTRRASQIENIDEIPIPNRRKLNLNFYLRPRLAIRGIVNRATHIMSSRGCPYDCRFCASKIMWYRKVRYHSVERVIRDTEETVALGFNGIFFQDDTFNVDKNRLLAICESFIRKGLNKNMNWTVQLHPGLVKKDDIELLKIMKQAGCVQVEYGLESGSSVTLEYLKKSTTSLEQNKLAIDIAKRSGLRVLGTFIVGVQGEKDDDVLKTRNFIVENLNNLDYFQIFPATPFPGTELWDRCEESGLLKHLSWEVLDMGLFNYAIFTNTASKDLVRKTISDMTSLAFKKVGIIDKIKWSISRFRDNPVYLLWRGLNLLSLSKLSNKLVKFLVKGRSG